MKSKTTYNFLPRPIIPLGMIRSVENRKLYRKFRMPLGMRPNCDNPTMVAFLRNAKWVVDAIFLPSDASLRDAGLPGGKGIANQVRNDDYNRYPAPHNLAPLSNFTNFMNFTN